MLRAAERGSAQAAFNIAVMYERGFVVPRDSTRAAQWYRRAADAGLAVARHNLALLLRDGKGVPRDSVQAIALPACGRAPGHDRLDVHAGRHLRDRRCRAQGCGRGGGLVLDHRRLRTPGQSRQGYSSSPAPPSSAPRRCSASSARPRSRARGISPSANIVALPTGWRCRSPRCRRQLLRHRHHRRRRHRRRHHRRRRLPARADTGRHVRSDAVDELDAGNTKRPTWHHHLCGKPDAARVASASVA